MSNWKDINAEGVPVKQIQGQIRVSSKPYGWSAALGEIANHEAYTVAGYRSDILSTLPNYEVISPLAASRPPMPFTASTVELVSTSVNDTSAGTGIQSVYIDGLDSTGARQTEVVTLNGTTAVTTVNSYTFINRLLANSVGTGGGAAGTITAQSVGGATVYLQIDPGTSDDQTLYFKVPTGYQIIIAGFSASAASKETLIRLRTDVFSDNGTRTVITNAGFSLAHMIVKDSFAVFSFDIAKIIPAGGMLWCDGVDLKAATGAVIANIDLIYEPV